MVTGEPQTPTELEELLLPEAGACSDLFVPGRLCLFGEHSDWAGSYRRLNPEIRPGRTIVVGTEQGVHARVQPLAHRSLVIRTTTNDGTHLAPKHFHLDPVALLREAQKGGFWSYVAGVAYRLVIQHEVGGLQIDNHCTSLPLKKGLSSSAAICVLVARAFNRVYGLRLSIRGEMEVAYQGERMTPSQCGRMDQASAFGSVPVLMTFDADALHVEVMQLGAPLHLVLVDLRAAKDTVAILGGLQAAYPHPEGPKHCALHDLLGPTNERITDSAVALMRAGKAESLGALMREAQAEFDAKAAPVCPEQLASPVLHRLLGYQPIQQLIWGGKGVGSQGDGTAQLLCRDAACQAAVGRIVTEQLGMHAMPLTLQPTAADNDSAAVMRQVAEEEVQKLQADLAAQQQQLLAIQQKLAAAQLRLQQLHSNNHTVSLAA